MLPPPQSFYLLLTRLCSQIPVPPHPLRKLSFKAKALVPLITSLHMKNACTDSGDGAKEPEIEQEGA